MPVIKLVADVKDIEVMCYGDPTLLYRPCVDCGRLTGCFCDFCLAVSHEPDAEWVPNQRTPLCTVCDTNFLACHFCRKQDWVAGEPWGV
jgi:hypothetical protein